MVQFILKAFSQDEEVQTIHLPIIFAAIMDLVDVITPHNPINQHDSYFTVAGPDRCG